MTVCGTALVVDHTWLIDPRDLLKTAADAGTVAATIEMNRQFLNDPDIGDADLQDALQQVAERYVILNLDHLTADRLEHAKETLEVQAQPDRATRSVDVNVSADLGGTLFAQYIPLFGGADMPGPIRTMSVVESTKVPVEVVLAIDVSTSMTRGVDGTPYVPYEDSRMKVVKDASLALMEALDPSPHHRIALGIVPWHFLVRLDKPARARWGGFQWVTYPNSRYYADPYRNWGGTIEPDGITQTLPSPPPQNWRGCLDEHRITGGAGHAETPATGDLSMPPPHLPFVQAFYPALEDHAYDCSPEPLPANYYLQFCYTQVVSNQTWKQRIHQPQHDCATSGAAMLPLSSNQVIIKDAIETLAAVGEGTYSSSTVRKLNLL